VGAKGNPRAGEVKLMPDFDFDTRTPQGANEQNRSRLPSTAHGLRGLLTASKLRILFIAGKLRRFFIANRLSSLFIGGGLVLFVAATTLGLIIYSSSELAGGGQKATDERPVARIKDDGPVDKKVTDERPVENLVGGMAFAAAGDIWIMNVDGSKPTRLTQGPLLEDTPTFSPDGKKVAFVQEIENTSGRRIVVMDVSGRNQVQLPVPEVPGDEVGSVREPSWTPDGRRVAFMAYSQPSYMPGCDEHVFITNADGTGTPRKFPIPGLSVCQSRTPVWSPDGSQIAFEASGKDSWPDIYLMDVSPEGATGRPRLLTPDYLQQAEGPSWSPDSSEIAFSGNRSGYHAPGKGYTAIFKIDVNSLEETRLTKGSFEDGYDTSPTWSPHGEKIAYVREGAETSAIYVVGSDGSDSILVRKFPPYTLYPDWRPLP
jgi:Tol biopolymer transport system component